MATKTQPNTGTITASTVEDVKDPPSLTAGDSLLRHYRETRDAVRKLDTEAADLRRKVDSLETASRGLADAKEAEKMHYYNAVDAGDKAGADESMRVLGELNQAIDRTRQDFAAIAEPAAQLLAQYNAIHNEAILLSARGREFMADVNTFATSAAGLLACLHGTVSNIQNAAFRAEGVR